MLESEANSILGNIRVLFVDDEEFVTRSMKHVLQRAFGEVYTALNGLEGLEQFQMHSPGLVITDITMPKMDGFEMIEKIRAIDSDTKFIVVSGHNDNRFTEKSQRYGAIHITKPIEKEDLVAAIQRALNLDLSVRL